MTGTYKRVMCKFCSYIQEGHQVELPNGQLKKIPYRVTCQTPGIVYMMNYQCGSFYIGKTKHPFFHRNQDHVSGVKKLKTPISRHLGIYHNFDLNMITFCALEHIPLSERRGNIDKYLFEHKSRWIYSRYMSPWSEWLFKLQSFFVFEYLCKFYLQPVDKIHYCIKQIYTSTVHL